MEINISTGTVPSKKKFVIYGTEGIGKSTFASKFPDSLFIDVEGGTKNMDVRRFADPPTSYAMLINYIDHVMQNAGICKTLVIDTIDWVERMIVNDVCTSHGKKVLTGTLKRFDENAVTIFDGKGEITFERKLIAHIVPVIKF